MLYPPLVVLVLQVRKCVIDVFIFSMKHVVWATVEPAEHQKRTHYKVSFIFRSFLQQVLYIHIKIILPTSHERNKYIYIYTECLIANFIIIVDSILFQRFGFVLVTRERGTKCSMCGTYSHNNLVEHRKNAASQRTLNF